MENVGVLMIGLFVIVIVSGCMSQTQEGTTTGNDQQNAVPPQGELAGQQGQGGGRGFSQEAVDACTGKSVNDSCEFKMNETTVQGECRSRRGGELTCFPSNMNQRPQGMVNACAGKAENETCGFTINQDTINGTCRSFRGGNLTCTTQGIGQKGGLFAGGSIDSTGGS